MPPVFAHGRLRLYLLKLLDEAPRHGYEVIRLLEERFQGLYAPSAGTVYPRLSKLEAEGLVTHTTEGGRKVYSITDAGRAELAARAGELEELELEIRDSVAELAAEIQADVSGTASDLRRDVKAAAREARSKGGTSGGWSWTGAGPGGEKEAWRQAKEEMKRAKDEWKEQARRAKDETRRAQQDAKAAREEAKAAHEALRDQATRIAKQVQDQVQAGARAGDWPGGLRDGLSELTRELGRLGSAAGTPWPGYIKPDPPTADLPDWAEADAPAADATPAELARELERLLDRFRDDVRDAARDHGVTPDQLREARRHLSTAAAHIAALLKSPQK
ncbi:helix-turn-helix transcriptional regulator [Streptomyces sp. A7024]|uniref:Helix-turn-helix transcriptional regulator n=1 Tax=Streptomyces coryli TaxID=1128680 RepID=A0A6G4U4W9_9ACTN|nr:PadR family transcriptional regulator [Streptomyces coryli]NGN67285.1 helix-turn-helix transcriptional regulator [Streptomyces coryli]